MIRKVYNFFRSRQRARRVAELRAERLQHLMTMAIIDGASTIGVALVNQIVGPHILRRPLTQKRLKRTRLRGVLDETKKPIA